MTTLFRRLLLLSSLFTLTACGGGGGESSAPPVVPVPPVELPPTPSEIIGDANSFTKSELRAAANSLATSQYTGNTQALELNLASSQKVTQLLFATEATNAPFFEILPYQRLRDINGAINDTIECPFSGSVTIVGQLNDDLQGKLTLDLVNCSVNTSEEISTGVVALNIDTYSDYSRNITYYYDDLDYVLYGTNASISGFIEHTNNYDAYTGEYKISQVNFTTVSFAGQSILLDSTASLSEISDARSFVVNGEIALFNEGRVSFSTKDLKDFPPYFYEGSISFVGDRTTSFEFENRFIKYWQDNDNDGSPDTGVYLEDINTILFGDLPVDALGAYANISKPPSVGEPNLQNNEVFTTTPIILEVGYIDDEDTNIQDLNISYLWYLNEELLSNQTSNILPSYIAVFGDDLKVGMLVSDGVNSIEGPLIQIQIMDSPQIVNISSIPDTIRAGDLLTFYAQIIDPDTPNRPANPAGQLVSGPSGSTMSVSGEVNWQVPTDLLFPIQTYTFTFSAAADENAAVELVTLDVDVESLKDMPLARKGIEVPKNNNSLAIGDFDGDGLNEILSTDSLSSVFLLQNTADGYAALWNYPFKIGSHDIVQVLAVDADNDAELEIVVVTKRSISIISDLQSMAKTLITTQDDIQQASLVDTNNDGILEIAYIVSSGSIWLEDAILSVVSMDALQEKLFTAQVGAAKEFAFGNVDNDSNIELVTNNGLVYDAFTWENQWTSSNEFGSAAIALGDYNNDGIDEIAAIDTWGPLKVYSVVDRAQIASIEGFNNCTLIAANVDATEADEIILGECQWGEVKAYALNSNNIDIVWALDSQDHGSTSLVAGDSDNDGNLEIHWGSGVSSSGADVFAGANVNTALGTATSIEVSEENIQLTSFSKAGWSNITDNNEQAIFFVPTSASGYSGSRVVHMQADGTTNLSSELSSNWSGNSHAVTTDFNNDGFGDVFLPFTELYDGVFAAMQLSNESIHWQTPRDSANNIGIIRAFDVNQDGFDDAIYIDNKTLQIADVINQVSLISLSLSNSINDFVSFKMGDSTLIALATAGKTVLYRYNGTSLSELHFVEQACNQLLVINSDQDADTELACLDQASNNYSNQKQVIIIFDIQNNNLIEAQRSEFDLRVSSISVDPSTSINQSLLLVADFWTDNNSYPSNNFIVKVRASGEIVWRSPSLIGSAQPNSLDARISVNGKLEILFATSQMMYWIK